MNILLVSATMREVEPLIEHFRLKSVQMNMLSGKSNSNKIDCLISGVGMMATTYSLTKTLAKKKYHLIINGGIAGSFHDNYIPGSVVEVINEHLADFGVDDNGIFRHVFEEKFIERDDFPFRDGVLMNPVKHHFTNHLPNTTGVTVNVASGSTERIGTIKEKFNPDIETMEGAAVFYVALQQHLPFVEIRSVSNFVEPRNRKNWKVPLAIEKLNSALIGIFEEI
ncbi:MAG TPA: futalosine hydrolase [Bacteroidales bacterium]|jgi:futalosine nucleosidase